MPGSLDIIDSGDTQIYFSSVPQPRYDPVFSDSDSDSDPDEIGPLYKDPHGLIDDDEDELYFEHQDTSSSSSAGTSQPCSPRPPPSRNELNQSNFFSDALSPREINPSLAFSFQNQPNAKYMVYHPRNPEESTCAYLVIHISTALVSVAHDAVYHFTASFEPATRILTALISFTAGAPAHTGCTPQSRLGVATRRMSTLGNVSMYTGACPTGCACGLVMPSPGIKSPHMKLYANDEGCRGRPPRTFGSAGDDFKEYVTRRDQTIGLRYIFGIGEDGRLMSEASRRPLWESASYQELRDKVPSTNIQGGGSGAQFCKRWEFEIPEGWETSKWGWELVEKEQHVRVLFREAKMKSWFERLGELLRLEQGLCDEDNESDDSHATLLSDGMELDAKAGDSLANDDALGGVEKLGLPIDTELPMVFTSCSLGEEKDLGQDRTAADVGGVREETDLVDPDSSGEFMFL